MWHGQRIVPQMQGYLGLNYETIILFDWRTMITFQCRGRLMRSCCMCSNLRHTLTYLLHRRFLEITLMYIFSRLMYSSFAHHI
ncbi:hypothetical protein HBA_0309 [Sodalis endosymbiont of Henestaris halophilus]|nr:hypothetical protein HBA_0309 [Sodalis endosymbiont of Henestaris halophilus]